MGVSSKLCLATCLTVAASCGPQAEDGPRCEDETLVPHLAREGTSPIPRRLCQTFEIEDFMPRDLHPEGGDSVTLFFSGNCASGSITIDGEPVAHLLDAQAPTFESPRRPEPWSESATARLEVACDVFSDERDFGRQFRNHRASADVRYSLSALIPPLPVVDKAPLGNHAGADAVLLVVFSEPVLEASLEGNLLFEGVEGSVSWDAASLTATFTPDEPLAVNRLYRGRVRAGEGGVRSAIRERPFLEDVTWTFWT